MRALVAHCKEGEAAFVVICIVADKALDVAIEVAFLVQALLGRGSEGDGPLQHSCSTRDVPLFDGDGS